MPGGQWGAPVWVVPGQAFLSGQLTSVSTTAQALGAATALSNSVLVQNSNSSSANLLLGSGPSNTPMELTPGQALQIPAQNLGQIYVKAASGTITVNYAYA